jgi:predicted nucleic acid-binding protein
VKRLDAIVKHCLRFCRSQTEAVDWPGLTRKPAARGTTRQGRDLPIAATARVRDLILLSRNVRDFADTGVLPFNARHGKHHPDG